MNLPEQEAFEAHFESCDECKQLPKGCKEGQKLHEAWVRAVHGLERK